MVTKEPGEPKLTRRGFLGLAVLGAGAVLTACGDRVLAGTGTTETAPQEPSASAPVTPGEVTTTPSAGETVDTSFLDGVENLNIADATQGTEFKKLTEAEQAGILKTHELINSMSIDELVGMITTQDGYTPEIQEGFKQYAELAYRTYVDYTIAMVNHTNTRNEPVLGMSKEALEGHRALLDAMKRDPRPAADDFLPQDSGNPSPNKPSAYKLTAELALYEATPFWVTTEPGKTITGVNGDQKIKEALIILAGSMSYSEVLARIDDVLAKIQASTDLSEIDYDTNTRADGFYRRVPNLDTVKIGPLQGMPDVSKITFTAAERGADRLITVYYSTAPSEALFEFNVG